MKKMKKIREHWENIYQQKPLSEVSWFEPDPKNSLRMIDGFNLPENAAIIDIGGGDSLLADHLLDLGYTDITVLDISETAITRAKQRLGTRAALINWVVCDMLVFQPDRKYDLWHDRAAFHFLTEEKEQQLYLAKVRSYLLTGGYLTLSTFATDGPEKCSGLAVQQYSESTLTYLLHPYFDKIRCFTSGHQTPFETVQKFIYCSFQHRKDS
ncbi:MAG: class I SAM-dependent methyltransferase [Mucilaginibacter sp.]